MDTLENSCINNLSNHKLDHYETIVLNKGLNFIYADNYSNHYKVNLELINSFERKMQIKLYFDKNKEKLNKTVNDSRPNYMPLNKTKIEPIKILSNWYPPKPNPYISAFCNRLKHEIKNISNKHKNIPNLNKEEMKALQRLRKNRDIIIKSADKGGGIVVMNSADYEDKILSHLFSNSTYIKVTENPLKKDELICEYRALIDELKPFLTKKQYFWLNDVKNEPGLIYGLPKIHKKGNPIRPIISQCNSLTNKLHTYLQQLLKIGESQIPNLIRDTTDFLNRIKKYNDQITEDTILVTLDVEALYTNIPLDLGIEYITEHYIKTLKCWKEFEIDIKPVPPILLKKILEFTLKNCYFMFKGNLYKQIQGLTMGGGSSVQEANIVMYKFFEKFNNTYPNHKWDHDRFIDDLFGIWTSTLDELNIYFNLLNSFHPSFKFTLNQSNKEIPFLDVKVIKTDSGLQTTIYIKPTDKKLYLNFHSNHPLHTKRSIPFSQFLRLKRIVSDPIDLQAQVIKMTNSFKLRNYSEQILSEALLKLSQVDRETLFKYKTKNKSIDRPILVIIFENKFNKKNILKKTIYKLWHELISEIPEIHRYFKEKPMIAFKNGKSIKKTLISTKYPAPWHLKQELRQNSSTLDTINLQNLVALLLNIEDSS